MSTAQDAMAIWKEIGTFFRGSGRLMSGSMPEDAIWSLSLDEVGELRRHLDRIGNAWVLERSGLVREVWSFGITISFSATELELEDPTRAFGRPSAQLRVIKSIAGWQATASYNSEWALHLGPAERFATVSSVPHIIWSKGVGEPDAINKGFYLQSPYPIVNGPLADNWYDVQRSSTELHELGDLYTDRRHARQSRLGQAIGDPNFSLFAWSHGGDDTAGLIRVEGEGFLIQHPDEYIRISARAPQSWWDARPLQLPFDGSMHAELVAAFGATDADVQVTGAPEPVAIARTKFQEADFWLQRRGSIENVGQVLREYAPENIGIKVVWREGTAGVDPRYLEYYMQHLHAEGLWRQLAQGSLRLQHILISDVRRVLDGLGALHALTVAGDLVAPPQPTLHLPASLSGILMRFLS